MVLRIPSMIIGSGKSRCAAPGVSTGPGAIAFTRILWRAHSTASVRVIASTPAFALAEWITPGPPVQA